MKHKINKWKIEVELWDEGDPLLQNIITLKNEKYFVTKRDIKGLFEYYFERIDQSVKYFKNLKIRRIK